MAQEACLQVTMGPVQLIRRSKIHSALTGVVAALLLTSEGPSVADGAPVQQEDATGRISPFQLLSQHILAERLPGVRTPEALRRPNPPVDERPFERPTGFLAVGAEEIVGALLQPVPSSESLRGPRGAREEQRGPPTHHERRAQQLDQGALDVEADDWDWDDWQEDERQQEEQQEEEQDDVELFRGNGIVPEWQLQGQPAEESALTNVRGAGRRRADTVQASTNARQRQQIQQQQVQQQYPDEEEDDWDLDSDQPVQGSQQQAQGEAQWNQRDPTAPPPSANRREAGATTAATAAAQQQEPDDDDWWDEDEDEPQEQQTGPQQQQQQQPPEQRQQPYQLQQQQRQQQPQEQRPQQRQQQQQADDPDASVRKRRRQFINAALAAAQAAATAFFDTAEVDDGQGVDLHQINQQVENIVNDFLNPRGADGSSSAPLRAASTDTAASVPYNEEARQILMQKYLQQQQDRAQQQLKQQQELRSTLLQQQAAQLQQLQEDAASRSRLGPSFDYRRNALEGFEGRRRDN